MNGFCAMINRLINAVALVCPTEKVTSISARHPQSVITVLKQLRLKLDQTLKKQYTRKSQANLNNKNGEEAAKNSRFTR
ncbi:MAG: hypothetical protein K0R24_1773 [Gammaproteobacteria bacterium]|nr:hypothetical protein [Gammaproteobacteria bacterium]